MLLSSPPLSKFLRRPFADRISWSSKIAKARASTAGLLLFVGMLWGNVASASPSILFKVPDDAPAGVKVEVLDSIDDIEPAVVPPAEGGFKYQVDLDPARWLTEPSFIITLPQRHTNDVDSREITLRLDFSFPVDSPDEVITVPLAFFSGTGSKERERIDDLPRFRFFEKILLSQALSEHYRQHLNPHDRSRVFMAKVWFETLFATISKKIPLRISEDVADVLSKAFDGNAEEASHLAGAQAQLRRLIWRDQNRVYDLVRHKSCRSAADLVGLLKQNLADHPSDASDEQVNDAAQVVAKLQQVTSACNSRN